jgi:uncharacterized protein YjiS (DUF1127 family)
MSILDISGIRRTGAKSLLLRLAALLRRLRRRHVARLTHRRLEALSDWQLKDIGLARSEIWYVSHRPWLGIKRRGHGAG